MGRLFVMLGLLGWVASVAVAAPLDAVRAAATSAAPFSQSEAQLDPRVQVQPCRQPLSASVLSASPQQATVRVSCTQPSWQLYVPVRATGDATVLVLKRPLAAGERIAAGDLESAPRDPATLGYGALSSPEAVIGRLARRSLPAGRVLIPGDVLAPPMVRRGDAVTLFVVRGAVEIRMGGEALADGAEGSRIAVRNSRSGRRLEGIVRDSGRVEIPG